MIIKFGHRVPGLDAPVETASSVVDDLRAHVGADEAGNETVELGPDYLAGYVTGTDGNEIRDHLFNNPGAVTHLPGNEAIPAIDAGLRQQTIDASTIAWVSVDAQDRDPENAADLERCLADLYRCERGRPADVEDTHHTMHGSTSFAPGDRPEEG